MSHKDAPPLTADQERFEVTYLRLQRPGETTGMGRDKDGRYFAERAQWCWALWQIAQQPVNGSPKHD